MSFAELKNRVFEANLEVNRRGLVLYTFGNVSEIDRDAGVMAIKPSGVDYDALTADDIVVLTLNGEIIESRLRPSSDTPTHLHLYQRFPTIGGVCHTHSTHATSWAQARRPIPCLGTTHADYMYGPIPCTQPLSEEQTTSAYELETGVELARVLADVEPLACPMALAAGHGPFTWGRNADQAVYHAVVLEELARMAWLTRSLAPDGPELEPHVLNKHYLRKHGSNAYYGQETNHDH